MESQPISFSTYPNIVNIQNHIIVLRFVHVEAQTLIMPLLSDGPMAYGSHLHFTANPGGIQGCCRIVKSTFVRVSFMS